MKGTYVKMKNGTYKFKTDLPQVITIFSDGDTFFAGICLNSYHPPGHPRTFARLNFSESGSFESSFAWRRGFCKNCCLLNCE